jgi:hypothetical protein
VPTWFDDYQRTRDDEAARRGADEAKKETILGSMLHEVADVEPGLIPIPKDSEDRAREHAYHTTPKGWERKSRRPQVASQDWSSSSSDAKPWNPVQWLFWLAVAMGLLYVAFELLHAVFPANASWLMYVFPGFILFIPGLVILSIVVDEAKETFGNKHG